MNRHIVLASVLTAMLLSFAFLSFALSQQLFLYSQGPQAAAETFLMGFRQVHQPMMELNFAELYKENGQFQMLHPLLDIRHLHLAISRASCGLPDAKDETDVREKNEAMICKQQKLIYDSNEGASKSRLLSYFLSGEWKISESFLSTPPFIDDSGHSYAYLLLPVITKSYRQSWIAAHLSFFKPSELKVILHDFQIDSPTFQAIAEFSEPELRELVEGTALALTKNFMMIRNQSKLGFSPLSYWVFDLRDLRADLIGKRFDLIPYNPEAICLEKIGNACWTYNSRTALSFVLHYAVAILILIASGIFIILALYIKNFRMKGREQLRHRFSMQVLSHEFRTPVSALLLLIEELNHRYSRFEEKDQDLITRLSSEVFRLQRIIEMGKTYLQSSSKKNRFNLTELPSIHAWIQEIAQDIDPRIRCEFQGADQSVSVDLFWLRFVIENLVQNAFAHGKEPVFIKIRKQGSKLFLTVEDQGICEFDSLDKMLEPFVKSTRSTGIGLGLNIIKVIISEWKTSLVYRKNPTSFTFALNKTQGRSSEK